MKYTIKKLPKSQVEIHVSVPEDEFSVFQEKALGQLAEKVHIEGFRAGKAPAGLVKDKIGVGEVNARAAEAAIEKHYKEILEKERLDIIGHPDAKIEKADPSLEYSITASFFPEVKLPDYKEIAKKNLKDRKKVIVEEKDIHDALTYIRESRASFVTVTRAAEKGDRVEVDFLVTDNGVPIEGGTSHNHPFILGEGRFVPGFEEEVVGMKEKEEKKFSLTMPKDYPNNLGGKKLDFLVTVKLVQQKNLPELNDNFVKGVGKFETVTELTESIRGGILQEKEEKERQRIDMKIAEEVAQKSNIDIPNILIESELDKMLREMKAGIEKMGMEFTKYLEHLKKTESDLRKEWVADAEKRVGVALVLRTIANTEHIEPTKEEIEIKANHSLEHFKEDGYDVTKIDTRALEDYSRSILRNEKVFEFLEKLV